MSVIRVLVVDDSELVRKRLCLMLAKHTEIQVVAEAASALEAIEKVKQYQPDVVLLDIAMPELNGLQATSLLKNVAPQTEILIVTQYAAGARGFLKKSDAGAELVQAVTAVFTKKQFLSKSLRAA